MRANTISERLRFPCSDTRERSPSAAETTKTRVSPLGRNARLQRDAANANAHLATLSRSVTALRTYIHTYIAMRVCALSSKKRIRSGRSSVEYAAQRIHRVRNGDSEDHDTSRANEPYAHAYAFAAHAICFVSIL